jgi:acyl-CoA synthetase (AMP-forming)/AMP-acid ligase II
MIKESGECEPAVLDSEDLLFMLYTSGSTGNPKGVAHSQAGYLLYASLTHKLVFDCNEGDIFGCVADIGWITGHSYVVYGPLANGVTTLLFESTPTYPDPGRSMFFIDFLFVYVDVKACAPLQVDTGKQFSVSKSTNFIPRRRPFDCFLNTAMNTLTSMTLALFEPLVLWYDCHNIVKPPRLACN